VRVVWTKQADAMLAEAFDYVAAERPAAALRWVDDVMQQSRSLAQFPDRGRMVPHDDQVTILAVLHARRAFDHSDIMGDAE